MFHYPRPGARLLRILMTSHAYNAFRGIFKHAASERHVLETQYLIKQRKFLP